MGQYNTSTLTRYVLIALSEAVPPPDVITRMRNNPTAVYDLGQEILLKQHVMSRLNRLRIKLNDLACQRRFIYNPQEKDILEAIGLAIEQRIEGTLSIWDQLEDRALLAVGATRFGEMASMTLPKFHQSLAATIVSTLPFQT